MTTAKTANGSLRRRTLLAAAVACAALGLAPGARARTGGAVDLTVVDRGTGRVLPVWRHDGRLFVAGRPGARYGLRVSNHTAARVLLVLSVDGVNVLSGETASYDQDGYVLDPYEAYDVTGWRKSNAEVAAFTFASLPNSYAARTGRPADVGVIGMAVFEEQAAAPASYAKATPPRPDLSESRDGRSRLNFAPPPAPAMRLSKPQAPGASGPVRAAPGAPASRATAEAAVQPPRNVDKLGTAHGARERSVIAFTDFVRATSYPQSTRLIEYDTYANLVARGVVSAPPYADHRPRPFPQEPTTEGFVPDPPGDR